VWRHWRSLRQARRAISAGPVEHMPSDDSIAIRDKRYVRRAPSADVTGTLSWALRHILPGLKRAKCGPGDLNRRGEGRHGPPPNRSTAEPGQRRIVRE
jgi:hypothetical protein